MPKYTRPKKTWFYPVDFKIKAVELSLINESLNSDIQAFLLASKYSDNTSLCKLSVFLKLIN